MADEPRRSGRATKGQHTKNDDELAPAATSTPVPSAAASTKSEPKSGKGKATKKGSDKQEDEESAEDDDADTIIRCVCGATAEDELGFAMICCDKCEAWQHNLCMDMPEEEEDLPDKYYCEQCRPGNHKGLLAAMKRGENPAKERMERRLAEMERKRGKKGRGRKSGGKGTGTPAKGTPVPESVEGAGKVGKRKFEETPVEVKKSASPAVPTTTATPSLGRRKSSAQVVLPDAKRRKSTVDGGGGHSRKSSVILPPVAADISDLPSNRQPAVKAVTAKSESVIKSLVKQGTYLLPSGSSANSLAAGLALQIENALIAIHGDPAGYKQQFMAILANIPKNSQLVLQLLEGQLTALEIAEMSSDDMANEDLQRERAKAIEQADKQAILITSADGPRVRKTHKGDEIIGGEEVSRVLGSGGGDDASWGTRRARREASDEAMPDADEGSHHGDSEDRPELPDDGDDAPRSLSVDTKPAARKASTNYNMDRAWASAHSPTLATSGNYARVAQAQPPARRDTTMHDADIDRLLKDEASSDEENAREPSPQVGDGSPHAPVWKGRIDMAGVASFAASARWVAGGDVGAKVPGGFGGLLPLKLDITGRIAVARADEYVSGMRWSQSNDVCCLAITPSARRVERENFEKIYRYFSEKGRWGVISGLGDLVRDAYLVTLDKADGAFPGFLEGLDNQTLPREREAEALILTLVVKTKSPHPSPANITASTPTIPAQSPVIPSASANGATLPAATTYPWATPLVLSILGEDVHAPAVVQLFTAVPDMTEEQMRNLKAALVQEPSARMDLGRLGAVLQGNADANGGAGS